MTTPSTKEEFKKSAITVLIALAPVILVGALFWRGSKNPEPPVVAVVAKTKRISDPDQPAAPAPVPAKQTEISTTAQKTPNPPPATTAENASKARSVENEKPATGRRRHVSVLPDPQPKQPDIAATPVQAPESASQKPEAPVQQAIQVECTFKKFPFGIVEHRTYPSHEMCDQAQKMWKEDLRLLEPDGTVNDKHVVRKEPAKIPGMAN